MPFKIDIQNIPNRIKNYVSILKSVLFMTDEKLIFWVLVLQT